MKSLKRMLGFLRRYWQITLAAYINLTLSSTAMLATPRLLQIPIDQGITAKDMSRIISLAAIMVGIVLQDPFLFSDSVADNIRYGRLDASEEEVEAASRLVNAHDFISRLPEAYDTEISERGSNLSQGQWQLISFARAILANPRILILDEATSSVDTRTEQLIQQAVGELLQGRTSFVIAHRLSTIRNADQVFVIEEGCLVERGIHETLLVQGGVYHGLYMSQFQRLEPNNNVDDRTSFRYNPV